MLEKSFGLIFFLKKSKNENNQNRFVYLRITVDGISKEISTKLTWTADRWNQLAGRATGTKEDARKLNQFLDVFSNDVHQHRKQLMDKGKAITAEILKDLVLGKATSEKTLVEVFREHNTRMEMLIGIEYVDATLSRYETTLNHVKAFIRWKFNKDDIALEELNYVFVSDLSFWLKGVKRIGTNATGKYIRNVKKIVAECVIKGWLAADPFAAFKVKMEDVNRVALNLAELEAIKQKEISIPRLAFVRDLFVFSCYTGLAYVDLKKLRYTDLIKGPDGEPWIDTARHKTRVQVRIPLFKPALMLIDRYRDEGERIEVFPTISNQKVNAYLKEIADICGIKKDLTFHLARHTFATTVLLGNGVPMETVSKLLGHKSIKITQIYAKIVDLKIVTDTAELRGKLSRVG